MERICKKIHQVQILAYAHAPIKANMKLITFNEKKNTPLMLQITFVAISKLTGGKLV